MNPIHTAVIFAAGEGKRLDQQHTAKPLVLIGNKPLILWNILQLQDAGVQRIVVVVGHRGSEIRRFLTGHHEIKVQIDFVENTDTSEHGLVASLPLLANTVPERSYALMADLIIHANPYEVFFESDSFLSLVDVRPDYVMQSGACSLVTLDHAYITGVSRAHLASDGVEVGVYAIPEGGFRALSECVGIEHVDSWEAVLNRLAADRRLLPVFLSEGEWFDVNTPATKIRAEIYHREKKFLPATFVHDSAFSFPRTDFIFFRDKKLKSDITIQHGLVDSLLTLSVVPASHVDSLHILLTDDIVGPLYAQRVVDGCAAAGLRLHVITVPHGESSKCLDMYGKISDEIFSAGIDKRSYILSLGGGVVNNIAGFLASTLYRGIGLIHFPTSMMAQVDAAIDFKQAINSEKGKNLLGSYYPAERILIDPGLLQTLDERHVRNGLSESIKHALTQDTAFFDYLMLHGAHVYDVDFLDFVVRTTIALKVPLLNGDTRDDFNEMLPQYGHCVGHAIEHLSGYELLHGEAIAIGMCVSAEISYVLGLCGQDLVDAHYAIFDRYQLPTRLPHSMSIEDVTAAIRYDKHYVIGNPQMALPVAIGQMHHEDGVYGIPIDYSLIERGLRINSHR